MAGINFAITGNPDGLIDAARQSESALKALKGAAENSGSSIDDVFSRMKSFAGAVTGIGLGVEGLRQFASQLVNIRSEFQDTEAKLKVFLKSEEAAKDMMEELEDLAWYNTFEFTDITKAAAQLLAYNTAAEDVGDTITRLSEIASGTGASLGDMVARFNKVKATDTIDSNMVQSFANMGVDIKSVVAELDGLSRSDLDGVTLNFSDLQRVIKHLTDEGGMFFGMMKERGKNISDSIAGVRDNFAIMMNEIGESVQVPIKAGIDKANSYIENWKEVAKAIGGAIVAFGSYKAAYATFEGIKTGKQKVNFALEQSELEEITKAVNAQREIEIQLLEQQLAAGTAARDADLELAVAKGTLTEAQALEITRLREVASEQVNQLTSKAQIAAEEHDNAVQMLQDIDQQIAQQERLLQESDSFIDNYENMSSSIQEMIENLGEETVETKVATAQSDRATAAKKLEELQTQRLAAAERVETTSKTAESTAATADAAAQAMDTVGKKVNEKQTKLLAKAQIMLKTVMEATGLSMLANPYVLAAAAIAGLCYGIYKLITAETAEERALRKQNEALEEQKNIIDQINDSVKQRTGVIQNNNATDYQRQSSFNELKAGNVVYTDDDGKEYDQETQELMNSVGKRLAEFYKTADALAAASRDEIDQLINEYSDEASWAMAEKKVEDYRAEVEKAQHTIDMLNELVQYGGRGATRLDYKRLREANKELEVAETILSDMRKTIDDTNWNKMSLEDKKADYETNLSPQIEPLNAELEEAQKRLEELGNSRWWQFELKAEKKKAEKDIQTIQDKLDNIEDKRIQITVIEENENADVSTDTSSTVKEILKQEREVAKLRDKYAKNSTDVNKSNLEKAVSILGVYTKRYQAQTNKSWKDSVKVQEEITKSVQKAANERIKIENSRIRTERVQRKAELDQQLKELEQQSREWSKQNNGRKNKSFAMQAENLKLEFEIDTQKADQQFEDWKRDFEKQTLHIKTDMEIVYLEQAVNLSTTIEERIKAQNALYQRQKEIKEEELRLEADQTAEQRLGGKEELQSFKTFIQDDGNRDVLSQYRVADDTGKQDIAIQIGLAKELLDTYIEIVDVYDLYNQRIEQTNQELEQGKVISSFNDELSRLEQWYTERERIAQEYNDRLEEINNSTGIDRVAATAQATKVRDEQVAQADKKLSMGDNKELERVFVNFAEQISVSAFDEIERVYNEFIANLSADIRKLESEITSANGIETNEQAQTQIDTIGQQLATGMNAEGEDLSEEEKLMLEQQKLDLENLLVEAMQRQVEIGTLLTGKQQQLVILKKGMAQAESSYITKLNAASEKETKSNTNLKKGLTSAEEGLQAVKFATKSVADAFGNTLSKKSSKALNVISDICDFGIQSIQSIQYVATNASTLMATTAEGAAGAVSAVEKASVILTIISLAVQAIMAIVKIASQYTQSAQMQEAIDKQLERVDELKRRNEALQRSYKNSYGTEYYKKMAAAARDYNNIIREQQRALKEATELYEYQKRKYADDSDKVKNAKDQMNDIEDSLNDYKDEQADLMAELRESLLTTDLSSFSENLADSLIDGFENGKEGIADTWEDMLDDLMRAMMKQQLSLALQNMFKSTFDKLNSYADDGELTQSKIDSIIAEMDAKSAQAEALAEQYYDLMDERGLLRDDVDNEGSRGGFESMSQDTADELNARFTALQIEGANVVVAAQGIQQAITEMLSYDKIKQTLIQGMADNCVLVAQIAQNQLDQLRIIADNTAELQDTNRRLRAIEQYTSRL
ncbi:MAG: hypothetical protein NC235_07645 [Clostridiales bacterium]|nr:hypothetical protein [Clostridiales bacterium]MCM1576970.1 hypothetical protein [Bacteroides sp.]